MDKDKKGLDMYAGTAYNTYAQNNVEVESPTKLVEMLYEGVLRFNGLAKQAMESGNIEKRAYWTNRSIAIVTELISMLNFDGGEVANYLEGLYNYQIRLMMEANMQNDIAKIDECNNVFKELLAAWRETTDVA